MPVKTIRAAAHTPCTRTMSWPNIDQRIAEVVDHIETLARLMGTNEISDPDELHMFVAPEWNFQKVHDKQANPNVNSFYAMKDLEKIITAMKAVSAEFPRMLIIPGSIVWAIPHTQRPEGYLAYNTVLAFHGGNLVHTYHKSDWGGDTPGGGTFGTTTGHDGFGNILRTSYQDGRGQSQQTNSHFFEVGGRTFGVEVCADHVNGRMMQQYTAANRNGPGIDVHVLVSCGQAINSKKVVARKGGLVVQSEGIYDNDFPSGISEGHSNKIDGLNVRRVMNRIGGISDHMENICTLDPEPMGFAHKNFVLEPLAKRIVIDKRKHPIEK